MSSGNLKIWIAAAVACAALLESSCSIAASAQEAKPRPAPAGLNETPIRVDYRVFPGLAHMDGNWSALIAASDGKVYVGLAYHGGDGHLVSYDPKRDVVRDLGAITQLCGEQSLQRGPQSKIHTKFGEGKDGRIYFGSQYGLDFDYARYATKQGYPGAHFMAYDPAADRVVDFGTGTPNEGLVTGNYDPLFNRYYGITDPKAHFVYYDVARHTVSDKGRINNWESLCRTLGIDDLGNVYGSFGHGQIFRYDPRTDDIRELSIRLPTRQKGISLGRDYNKSETGWRVVVWDAQTRKFYGVEESASTLFSFDPNAGHDGEIRRLGQVCIPGFEDSRDIPYATLSLTLGHDRKLYYAAAGREFDYAASTGVASSHLIAYDLRNGKIQDLGAMCLPDGRAVIGTNSAHTGPDGTIYFVGAIEVRAESGKPMEAGGDIGGVHYRLALLIYRPR
jgi:hypothetical protein